MDGMETYKPKQQMPTKQLIKQMFKKQNAHQEEKVEGDKS